MSAAREEQGRARGETHEPATQVPSVYDRNHVTHGAARCHDRGCFLIHV